jgi:cell division protease FtsH
LAAQGRFATATFLDVDNQVTGTFTPGSGPAPGSGPMPGGLPANSPVANPNASGRYWAAIPSNGLGFDLLESLFRTAGAQVRVDPQPTKEAIKQVTTFLLPLMILANLFALMIGAGRGAGSAIGEVMLFGTLRRGQAKKGVTSVGFADVGGAEEAVAEMREVRDYLADPRRYAALGAAPPKGVLLFGPPGTGKTLLAKAVAGEASVPFFWVAGAEFVESLVGVGAARVRDLFARVRAAAPAIVFIDELDALARRGVAGAATGGSDERDQTLNQLLVEMDGFEISAGIVVIAATNRPDILDPALLRPGRFDRHITIERPDIDGRIEILHIHGRGKPISDDVDLTYIAKRTPGFTGADLANVVNESVLLAIRHGRTVVGLEEFEEAIQRVLTGPRRRGRVMSPAERRRVSYHEAGHAIVSAGLGDAEQIHRVTILGRGRTLATTALRSDLEANLLTHSELRRRLVELLAGNSAEMLALGEASTIGEQDLERATELARDMATRYGMSDTLGPVRTVAKSDAGLLGDQLPLAEISDETHRAVDADIRRLIAEAQAQASGLLLRHRTALDKLAERLSEEETLEGAPLQSLLARVAAATEPVPAGNGRSAGARARGASRARKSADR